LPPRERIFALDVLRGFAVLGLLAANVVLFAYPTAKATSLEGWTGLDAALRMAVGAFVEGKFYSLFSILFGVGLWMQAARAAGSGRPFARFWARRMAGLALIGLAHGILFFPGDILFFYAIVGLAALPLRHLDRRALAGAACATFLAGLIAIGVHAAHYPEAPSPRAPDWEALATAADGRHTADPPDSYWKDRLADTDPLFLRFMADEVRIVTAGSWMEQLHHNAANYLLVNMSLRMLFTFWWVLAYFLLGVWIAKRFDLGGQAPAASLLLGVTVGGFLAGMILQGIGGITGLPGPVAVSIPAGLGLALIGTLCLAASYAAALVGLSASARLGWLTWPLAATGRMSLSNYVGQSVVCAAIFNNWGLGLFDALPFTKVLLLVPAIYALQVVASALWMSRFRYGPLEWLWRSASYGARQPLLR
jgi:uncharacterized protein